MTDLCTCVTIAQSLRAQLEQREVPPCAEHDPDAHRRHQAEHDRARARAEADDLADTLGVTVRDAEPEPDPLAASLARKLPRSNVVPLNADPSAYEALRPYLSNPTPDGPDAA